MPALHTCQHLLLSALISVILAGGMFIFWGTREYADDTTLMAESEEELKSLLMKVKEESEKVGLKAQHSEN